MSFQSTKLICAFIPIVVILVWPTSHLVQAQNARADTLLAQAMRLGDLYNWSDAAPLFAEAEQLFSQQGDARNALLAKVGRIRSTMEQLSLPELSEMLERELESNPLLQTNKPLRLFCLAVKGDIDGELDSKPMRHDWQDVLELARELGDKKWENRASGEIGFAAFLEGDVATAQKMVAGALLVATTSRDVGAQIRYLAAIGTGLAMTGLPEQGLTYFDRAARIAEQAPEAGYQFLIYTGKLTALREVGRLDEADKLANELIAEARARNKRVKETQVLISASGVSIARKNYSKAAEQLRMAIGLAEEGQITRLLADAQFELASVYRTTGDLRQAQQMAASAAIFSQSGGEIYELPKRLSYLAQLDVSLGKYREADAAYDRASDFVDTMVGNVSRVATKGALITAMGETFTQHFSLIADHLNNVPKAYEVLERARGRATTDLLRAGAAANTNQDRKVDREVSKLRLVLLKARSPDESRRIRDRIFLVEQSRWLSPASSIAGSGPPETIPLGVLRRSIASNELILEYVLAEANSYCLVISNDRARIVRLPGRKVIEQLVSSYLTTIRSKSTSASQARQLFDVLVKPISEFAGKSRVSIVRDGQLHLLPFDALIDVSGKYTLETHIITYAPSASTWYLLKRSPAPQVAERTLLGVGGVPYDEDLTKIATTRGYQADRLGNLPGSRDEIITAAELMQGEKMLLLGSDATEAAFKKASSDRYRLIHLAVHGIANAQRPDQAALILASDPAVGEDGILQASEIVQLRTNAELVVLSACDTAIGRLQGAEGIANLARAFLLSGGRTVVATLWAIDDNFSLTLMRHFYRHLSAGKTIADSLTEAKRDVLRTFGSQATPYHWAGFTIEGVGDRPIRSSPGKN